MIAELKRVHSPDVANLENYIPEIQDNFGFLLEIIVGPKGQEGEESFGIEVCTPKWLEEKHTLEDVVFLRHHLVVREYNYERITQSIKKYLSSCSGTNWIEVAEKVSRIAHWEFEDYNPR